MLIDFESNINRDSIFKTRSSRLKDVIAAINRYLANESLHGLEEIEAAMAKWRQQDPKEYADRGKPLEKEFANDIRLEGKKWGWGQGWIRLVDKSSHPRFQPDIWNDNGRIQNSTNCYAYACNDAYGHTAGQKPQPGMIYGPTGRLVVQGATNASPIVLQVANHRLNSGTWVDVFDVHGNTAANTHVQQGQDWNRVKRPWVITNVDANHFSLNGSAGNGVYTGGGQVFQSPTHSSVRLQVMMDDQRRDHDRQQRLIPLIRLRGEREPTNVVNVRGYYLIALVVARGEDYHWFRQDDSGLWSHKPGHTRATDKDFAGKVIIDPRDCDLGMYKFSTFYYAPKGGVRTASLGDWSDPNWHY